MHCLFCNSNNIKSLSLPLNRFNKKSFSYHKCCDCGLMFIDPIPNEVDLIKMYPPTYQGKIETDKIDIYRKMPGLRFSYKKQFDLILKHTKAGDRIIDFGCGTGHFVFNSFVNGIKMDGVEFSAEVVEKLNKYIPDSRFQVINEFFNNNIHYHLIRLSNVLEHFTNPHKEFSQIISKLEDNGVLLLEGPLERNWSLVNFMKWKYFNLRYILNKNYQTNHVPTHIFFSNSNNQLRFFERAGLKTILFEVHENAWPYPESINEVKSVGMFIKYIIGLKSKFIGLFLPKYGNTFLYVGQKG